MRLYLRSSGRAQGLSAATVAEGVAVALAALRAGRAVLAPSGPPRGGGHCVLVLVLVLVPSYAQALTSAAHNSALAKVWVEWAQLCHDEYRASNETHTDYIEQALTSYLQALRCGYPNGPRNCVPQLLWIVARDHDGAVVQRIFDPQHFKQVCVRTSVARPALRTITRSSCVPDDALRCATLHIRHAALRFRLRTLFHARPIEAITAPEKSRDSM